MYVVLPPGFLSSAQRAVVAGAKPGGSLMDNQLRVLQSRPDKLQLSYNSKQNTLHEATKGACLSWPFQYILLHQNPQFDVLITFLLR